MKSDLFNKRDVIAYFFVAASGAMIQLLIGSVSQNWFPITYRESLTLAYVIASIFGFFLTRMFGFSTQNKTKSRREMLKFAMVAVLSYLITVYGSAALYSISVGTVGLHSVLIPYSVKSVEVNKLISQITCMGFSFISNYILHKRFTFNNTGFYERLKKLL
jgi:putative flippase GtrA